MTTTQYRNQYFDASMVECCCVFLGQRINPGRRFWSCPIYNTSECNAFRWRDGEIDQRSTYVIPKLVGRIKELEDAQAYQESKIQWLEKNLCHDNVMNSQKASPDNAQNEDLEMEDRERDDLIKLSKGKKKRCCSFTALIIGCILIALLIGIFQKKDEHCKCRQLALP